MNGANPLTVPGRPRSNDFSDVLSSANTLSVSQGTAQSITLIGYFKYLVGVGPVLGFDSVVLDPANLSGFGPIVMTVNSLMSSEAAPGQPVTVSPLLPGFRNFEGLVASPAQPLPFGLLGPVDIALSFGSGEAFLLPGKVLIVP
jgi:hypothetical protein